MTKRIFLFIKYKYKPSFNIFYFPLKLIKILLIIISVTVKNIAIYFLMLYSRRCGVMDDNTSVQSLPAAKSFALAEGEK